MAFILFVIRNDKESVNFFLKDLCIDHSNFSISSDIPKYTSTIILTSTKI